MAKQQKSAVNNCQQYTDTVHGCQIAPYYHAMCPSIKHWECVNKWPPPLAHISNISLQHRLTTTKTGRNGHMSSYPPGTIANSQQKQFRRKRALIGRVWLRTWARDQGWAGAVWCAASSEHSTFFLFSTIASQSKVSLETIFLQQIWTATLTRSCDRLPSTSNFPWYSHILYHACSIKYKIKQGKYWVW